MAIDFDKIASAALSSAEGLLCELFPAGRRDGSEFRVGGLTGEPGRSLSVNLRSGKWCDFASGDSGSDLVALWSAARSCSMADAARELDDRLRAGGITATAPKADARPGRADPGEWEALPCAPSEIAAPTVKRLFREGEWREYPVANTWCYRDAQGRLVGFVCRVDFPDGSKDVFPHTYARNRATGREEWRWKAFASPRPLYRLPELTATAPDVGVLVVEGEKAAAAAARLMPTLAVVTWPGGSKAVHLADWSVLAGRRVTLWPDADEAGTKAMAKIADLLQGVAASTFIVLPPEGAAEGWDLADAEAEGWDTNRVRAHVRQRREAAANVSAPALQSPAVAAPTPTDEPLPGEPGEPVDDTQPPESAPHTSSFDAPFAFLGFGQGKHYYLSHKSGQVFDLSASEHTKLNFLELAPLAWWEQMFAGEKGPDWVLAANALIQRSKARDVFDPRKIRGRGAWIDAGRIVFHSGNKLFVDGVECGIGEIESEYIYTRGLRLEADTAAPASNAEAAKLIAVCESLAWRHQLSAKFLAGWVAIAPICGALAWRPHIWLSGQRGTGKSTIINSIVRPVVGRSCLEVVGATTEAGIRQHLACDALAVLYDEAEAELKRGQDRMQAVLEFARPCSSESEAIVAKGTSSGGGMQFKPRSMICFASIGVAAVQAADTSRIAVLELRKRGADYQEAFATSLKLMADSVGRDGYTESIRSRSLSLARVIRDNAKVFARVVGQRLGDARSGDQIGTLLAGAYSLTSRNVISEGDADDWVNRQDWSFFEPHEADSDQNRAFTMLVDAHVRIERNDGPVITRTVGELVEAATDPAGDQSAAAAILMRHGLRVIAEESVVAIANGHQFLARVFADSPWAGKHRDQFARLKDARAADGVIAFGPGSRHRAVLVPLSHFGN